jgi:WD40 repeat protein
VRRSRPRVDAATASARARRRFGRSGAGRAESTVEPTPDPVAAGTPDVFVSYAREDIRFVRELAAALQARGKDVWVDFDDIPDWSPDYEAELESAIRGANAFVFVLSPASVASPNCRSELDVAVAGGKRLRPVLHRAVEDGTVPTSLRKPQWLDLTQLGGPSVEKLVAALDVDPEWAHAHTRLLVRAHEWEARGRDASLLLNGSDLRAAELRLEGQAGKEPAPTPLQTEFVLASRRAANRRQRITLGSVAVAFALTLALALFALVLRSKAIHDAKVARSRELAALSLGAPGSNPGRVLQLALDASGEWETPEAEDALRLALVRSAQVASAEGIAEAAFAPDGGVRYACTDGTIGELIEGTAGTCPTKGARTYEAIVFGTGGRYALELGRRSARVVDTATGAVKGTIPLERKDTVEVDDSAVTPDGRHALITYREARTAELWAMPARAGPARRTWREANVRGVGLSPDGRRFATADEDGVLRVWNPTTALLVASVRDARIDGTFVRMDGDDAVVASGESVTVWRLTGRPRLQRFPKAAAGAVSPNGEALAVAYRSQVEIRRFSDPGEASTEFRAELEDVDFSADGGSILGTLRNGAGVWSASTGRRVGLVPNRRLTVRRAAISPDGRRVFVEDLDGTVRLWRVSPAPVLAEHDDAPPPPSPGVEEPPLVSGIAADGTQSTTVFQDGTVRFWKWARSAPATFHMRGAIAPSGDGRFVASIDAHRIRIRSTTGRVVSTVDADGAYPAVFSPDDTLLAAVVGGSALEVWKTANGREVTSLQGAVPKGSDDVELALSPANDRVAAWVSRSPQITLLDLATGHRVAVDVPSRKVTNAVFGPDGKLLAVASFDTVFVVSARDGTPVRTIAVREGPENGVDHIASVTFSPDSRLLVTGWGDGTLRVWELATGAERYALRGTDAPTFSLDGAAFAAFDGVDTGVWSSFSGKRLLTLADGGQPIGWSRDGTRLATLSGDALRLYGCDPCGSLERLKALARRRLGTR